MINNLGPLTRAPHEAILAGKGQARQLDRDILAKLARRPMTVMQLASATLRGRTTIDAALLRMEAAGKVQRSHGANTGNTPAVWSLVEQR